MRTRAKEIVELLGDLDRVRAERRKAKGNRNKYIGTGNDTSSYMESGGRYGGFGNESFGGGGAGDDGKSRGLELGSRIQAHFIQCRVLRWRGRVI